MRFIGTNRNPAKDSRGHIGGKAVSPTVNGLPRRGSHPFYLVLKAASIARMIFSAFNVEKLMFFSAK